MSGISDQVALFGATKLHAKGSEHGKVKHCMELLKELNKKSLSDLEPKGIRKYNCKHVNMAKTYSVLRLSENWSMLKQISSRHVNELDALTTEQGMTI